MQPGPDRQGAAGVAPAGLPRLETARWPQVAASDKWLLLWPVGSTEQHGPHLPLNTDTVVAAELCASAHGRFPELGLAPALPIGASGEHADFPGTLSIGTGALVGVVTEFVRHACLHWRHIVIVNGHGGNVEALHTAQQMMQREGRRLTVWHAADRGPRTDAHAGFQETSLMMYLRPGTVREDLAEAGATQPLRELIDQLQVGGVRSVSPNGILGDPTGATAEHGAQIYGRMLQSLTAVIAPILARRPSS